MKQGPEGLTKEWTEERPWGRFLNLLETPFTKVKLIEIDPNQRLSYQSHFKRRESWTVVKGEARITLEEKVIRLSRGEQIDIPIGAKHRIENPSNEVLSIIEVQTGDYFGEDDIIRYFDDYGRKEFTITT